MTLLDEPPTHSATANDNGGGLILRLRLTGRAAGIGLVAFVACALFPLWLTAAVLTPLTVVAPLLLPATWLVRRYADAHRRAATTVLGPIRECCPRPAETTLPDRGVIGRVVAILRDPMRWREALWLLVHAVVAPVLSLLSVALLLGTVFYLIFPFLWWVTPPAAFSNPFGFFTIDSLGESFLLVPLAVVSFGLWWVTAMPLARAVAATDRSLLT